MDSYEGINVVDLRLKGIKVYYKVNDIDLRLLEKAARSRIAVRNTRHQAGQGFQSSALCSDKNRKTAGFGSGKCWYGRP